MFKSRRLICPSCGGQDTRCLWDYDALPQCPSCSTPMALNMTPVNRAPGVIPDDIPGGVLIEHGICNPDGTPRRYYSKSEMRQAGKALGLVNAVEHKPRRGGDTSPHTTRWI